jgi:molecular chaperone HtpG
MSTTAETYQFQTEARQLAGPHDPFHLLEQGHLPARVDHPTPRTRIDKRRFEAVQQPELHAERHCAAHICLDDRRRRRARLTIWDNGIGMSRDELIDLIGTIAKSGTQASLPSA